MTARDDWPNPGRYVRHEEMCDEIDRLRDFNQRLMKELSQHGWGDMHYSVATPQDPSIVALLDEGGYQYDRQPFDTEHNRITLRREIYLTDGVGTASSQQSGSDASSIRGDRESEQRQDPVRRSRRGEDDHRTRLLHEEGGSS